MEQCSLGRLNYNRRGRQRWIEFQARGFGEKDTTVEENVISHVAMNRVHISLLYLSKMHSDVETS